MAVCLFACGDNDEIVFFIIMVEEMIFVNAESHLCSADTMNLDELELYRMSGTILLVIKKILNE